MKRLLIILGSITAVLLIAIVAAMIFLPSILSSYVARTSGYPLEVSDIKVLPWSGSVEVSGLVLKNPSGFPEEGFIEVAKFEASVALLSLPGSGQVDIRRLHLDLPYAAYVTSSDEQNNVLRFIDSFVDRTQQTDEPGRPWIIRDLDLKIGRLRYADFSTGGRPREMNITANLQLHLTDVTEPGQIVAPLISELKLKGFTEFAGLVTRSLLDLRTYTALTGNLLRGTGDLIGSGTRVIGDVLRRATGGGGTGGNNEQPKP